MSRLLPYRRVAIGLCVVVSIAGLSLAAAPGVSPPTSDEYADHVAELRAEIATISREIEQQATEHAVAARVIELASADLEKADNDREARRIRKIVEQYGARLERIELDRIQLEEHRARLVAAMAEMETRYEATLGEREAQGAADAAEKRDERIRGLTARLEGLRERTDDGSNTAGQRQTAINQIEALRLALPALREVDRHDGAQRLEMAIRLREMTLEGRRDDIERALRKEAPGPEELRELLGLAAEWWHAQGHEGRAETIARMTEALWSRDGRPAKTTDRDDGGRAAIIHRIESLQEHLDQVHAMVEAMYEELADVKRAAVEGR